MKLIYFEGEPSRLERLKNVKYWLLFNYYHFEDYIVSLEDWKGTLIVTWKKDKQIEPFYLALAECAWNLQGEDQIEHVQDGISIDCIIK